MAVDLSTIVRGASGVVFVLFGIACAILARRTGADRASAWALAFFATGFGMAFALVNLNNALDGRSATPLTHAGFASWLVAFAGALAFARRALPSEPREAAFAIGIGAAHGLAAALPLLLDPAASISAQRVPPEAQLSAYLSQVVLRLLAGILLAIAFALLARGLAQPQRRRALVPLALGLGIYAAPLHGFVLASPPIPGLGVAQVVGSLALGLLVVRWLLAAERGLGRAGVAAALALGAVTLLAMVEATLVEDALRRYINGVTRTIAVALIALAVFRHDALRAGLAARTADRATRATVGLAVLLVVAQVAQNYLTSAGGLLLGSVLAGALLFAAAPLQRAFEGRGSDEASKLATYRDAVRYALRDGVVTRKEEMHLAALAQQLGIGAADALRTRHEDEREGVKRNP